MLFRRKGHVLPFAKQLRGCAMKRDIRKGTPRPRNLNRREVLTLIGATAAASLVGGTGEQIASAIQMNSPTQNAKSRPVKIDAKPEPITIDSAKTSVIVLALKNTFFPTRRSSAHQGYV